MRKGEKNRRGKLMNGNKIGCIVQARMGSARLPGKSLAKIAGKPMLEIIAERLALCKKLDLVVVATSTAGKDDAIAEYCKEQGIECCRGSENNVLKRYYNCAKAHKLDIIIRITGDCPLVDPETVDLAIEKFLQKKFDYVSNVALRSFPRGLEVEVFSFKALEKAFKEAKNDFDKEHVTHYIYANPGLFRIGHIRAEKALFKPGLRFCVDTKKDIELMEAIFSKLGTKAKAEKVIALVEDDKELKQISCIEEEKYRVERGNVQQITVRPVNLSDLGWILKLRNQPAVRKNAFRQEKISQKSNMEYWEKKLQSPDFEGVAILAGKTIAGLARIDEGIVSIAIDEKFVGKGIAFTALSGLNLKGCVAEIKPGNAASIKLFKKLGFEEKEASNEKIVFKKA